MLASANEGAALIGGLSCTMANCGSDGKKMSTITSYGENAMATWREQAAPIIAAIIEKQGRADMKALKKAISDAYPFGQRDYHPYKIWCSEVKRQLQEPEARTMTIKEALQIEADIWNGECLNLSEMDCYRLAKLCKPLGKAEQFPQLCDQGIPEKDAKFLRRIYKKSCPELEDKA